MKKVTDYLVVKEVEGWDYFGEILEDHYSYVCKEDGIQLIFSIVDHGLLRVIHVSLNPMKTLKPHLSEKEHEILIIEKAVHIIHTFFGDRQFAKRPSDPRSPCTKNYFALLNLDE